MMEQGKRFIIEGLAGIGQGKQDGLFQNKWKQKINGATS